VWRMCWPDHELKRASSYGEDEDEEWKAEREQIADEELIGSPCQVHAIPILRPAHQHWLW